MTKKEYIRRYVHLKIQSGEWKPGDKILSENQIAIKFDCSRITARQSLMPFIYSGALQAVKGNGYIVSDPSLSGLISQTEAFNIDEAKITPFKELPNGYSKILGVEPNDRCIYFQKDYYKDGIKVSSQITALNKNSIWEVDYSRLEESITNELSRQGVIIKKSSISLELSSDKCFKNIATDLNWRGDFIIENIKSFSDASWIEKTVKITNKKMFKINYTKFRSY